jgi:putative oxidoreductase
MRIVTIIARLLMGLVFTVFGLNGFLHFLPMPPMEGIAGQFMQALFESHYLYPIFALQLVGGVLLLANQFVPLALTLLGPVLVNILLFHALMEPKGLPVALVVLVLWVVVYWSVRQSFAGVFVRQPAQSV